MKHARPAVTAGTLALMRSVAAPAPARATTREITRIAGNLYRFRNNFHYKVEAIDFDILVPGHGPLGGRTDATARREYVQALYAAVLKAAREGQSLEQMKQDIRLDTYSGFGQYEQWLPLNIEGMYRRIMLHRRGN